MEGEGRMDALAMARVPRLDVSLALTTTGLGVAVAALGEPLGLLPLAWEPALLGLGGGLLAGAVLRVQSRIDGGLPNQGSARLRFLCGWVGAGAFTGALVCALLQRTLPRYIPPPIFDGIWVGALAALVAFPACLWLLDRARECVRARLGSVVSRADRRAIWSVTGVLLATSSLTGLWAYASRLQRFDPTVSIALTGVGTAIALAVLVADRRARRLLTRLSAQRESMKVLHLAADEDCGAKTDLGVGQAVVGTHEAGATYRGEGRRVPLVRGSFHDARLMIDRAVARSLRRFAVTAAMLGVQVVAWAFAG